jgi:hypothetical protein
MPHVGPSGFRIAELDRGRKCDAAPSQGAGHKTLHKDMVPLGFVSKKG